MAVITKEQVQFLLEESVKVRMENEALRTQLAEKNAAYDKGYDDGHRDGYRLACQNTTKPA